MHKTSNYLQELPEDQRTDAVNSMVYEANARIRDPVYGCAGAICQLQKQISELQAELAKAQVEMLNVQSQNANLVALIFREMSHNQVNKDKNDMHSFIEIPASCWKTIVYMQLGNHFGHDRKKCWNISTKLYFNNISPT